MGNFVCPRSPSADGCTALPLYALRHRSVLWPVDSSFIRHLSAVWPLTVFVDVERRRTPTVMPQHRENVALVKQHGASSHLWTTLTGSGEGERTSISVWRQARRTVIGSSRIFFLTPPWLWWIMNERQLLKNVLEQKCSFILGAMPGGPIDEKKMGGTFHLCICWKQWKPVAQQNNFTIFLCKHCQFPLFYCHTLSGCNRQGRKERKIKIADVSNRNSSSPLKISAGVRCDPGIPARLITQQDKLLWWRFITGPNFYLQFRISHLGLAGKVRLLIMSPTTYPIRTDSKKKKNWEAELKLETVIGYLSPNRVQKYRVVFPLWHSVRGVSERKVLVRVTAQVAIYVTWWPFFKSCWLFLFLRVLVKIVSLFCFFLYFDWCTVSKTDCCLHTCGIQGHC